MHFPRSVNVVEVGPRDGLQNEVRNLSTPDKITLIQKLAAAGLREMEVTSFVSPKAIPNLADAEVVMEGVRDLKIKRFALVANEKGYERAAAAGVDGITVVISTTESHNRANINRPIALSIEFLSGIAERARRDSILVHVAFSVAFGCPFEGNPGLDKVLRLTETVIERGAVRISLCDTLGIANPKQVYEWVGTVLREFPSIECGLHFHDTYGRGLANVLAGLEAGVTRFDSSIGGLGGCPFAPGASGNICTEDMVAMLDGTGVNTGIDVGGLLEASDFLAQKLERRLTSSLWQVKQSQCTTPRVPV
jgi:hydroxymethylglutaryl-CoA lyase